MYFIHVYMYIYFQKKKIQDFQIFPKKEKNFQQKKKKILWTRGIELPSDFFKKAHFFFFQRFQDSLKSSFQNGT